MKKFLFLVLVCISFAGKSQEHICASSKIKSYSLKKKAVATRETVRLMEFYDVRYHKFKLQLEKDTTYIQGSVVSGVSSLKNGLDTFAFELHSNLVLDSIINTKGESLSFTRVNHGVYCKLNQSYNKGEWIELEIYYHGLPPSDASAAIGNGFSTGRSQTYGAQITWSLSQPYAAMEWWPCKQSLNDKIDSVDLEITTGKNNRVGSNGKLIQVLSINNNSNRFDWKSRYPIDYYLISVSVGEYIEITDYAKPKGYSDSILIQHYLYNQKAYTNNKANIDATTDMLEYFSELFGLYPFHKEKYGHSMAPFSGGMEHQTMTTQGIFPYTIVAHELGHQWFGDHVTCGSWSDLWLNEGFATYTEFLALEGLKPGEEKAEMIDVHNNAKNGTESIYIIDTANVPRLFSSSLTYNKGGAVLHMLRYVVGDSAFFAGLKLYLKTFGGSTARTPDFQNVMEQVSGKNLNAFFNEWIYSRAYPSYIISWNYTPGFVHLLSNQKNAKGYSNLFSIPMNYRFYYHKGDSLDIRYDGTTNENDYHKIAVTDSVVKIVFDPENYILNDIVILKNPALTSIESLSFESEFTVFPNPAKESIQVQSKIMDFELSLYDLNGKLLETCSGMNKDKTLNCHLPNGLYLLKIQTEKGNHFRKIQIQN
ncbi:MAG: M1 family aminopeptidase [Bacteroidia bacterium]